MIFTTREDVEAPIGAVFAMLCEFESFERSAMRRGAEVQRLDALSAPGVGMPWAAAFDLRGRRRRIELELTTFDPPGEMVFESTSPGMIGQMRFELIALSRSRTRVLVQLEVKPLNLAARLMVQSMKIAKASMTKRYKQRVAEYARGMEERYARSV